MASDKADELRAGDISKYIYRVKTNKKDNDGNDIYETIIQTAD